MSVQFYESLHITQPLFSSLRAYLSAPPCGLPSQPVKDNIADTKAIWVKYIQHDLFGDQEGPPAPRPLPLHPPWIGRLATLADWVSKVKKGSGTGRRNQITPIDHPLCVLLWEPRPRPQNQSPAIVSERGLLRTQESRQRHGRLCVLCSVWHPIPHITVWCCDCSQSQVIWL